MVNIYLDANILLDILTHRQQFDILALGQNRPIISTLSVHIAAYSAKVFQPDTEFKAVVDLFTLIPLENVIVNLSLKGPTSDFEDNVQLHSAVKAQANYFITRDIALLKLGIFGSTQILHPKDLKDNL